MRGSRKRDRKPPSLPWGLRYPPGRVFTGRAILMAPAPSFVHLVLTGEIWVLPVLPCGWAVGRRPSERGDHCCRYCPARAPAVMAPLPGSLL